MIGVDIGTSFIKVCALSFGEGDTPSVRYALKEHSPGNNSLKSETVRSLVTEIFGDITGKPMEAATGVGSSEILFRSIDFPSMPEEELRSSIKLQAEKFIYSDISEMGIDFSILSKDETENKLKILLAAAPNSEIESKVEIIQEAGLYAMVVDVDVLSMVNGFMRLYKNSGEESLIIIDCGSEYTKFVILNCGRYCFAKNMRYGGSKITAVIAEELGIDVLKAEEIKRNPGVWDAAGLNMNKVLRKSTPDLIETIHRSVEFCRGQNLIRNVDNIFFTGGTALLPGFIEFVSQILGEGVHCWNPLNMVPGGADNPDGMFLSTAIGLALSR